MADEEQFRERITYFGGSRTAHQVELSPPRRGMRLPREIASARILAAAERVIEEDRHAYQLSFRIFMRSGPAAFYPRRFGVPIDNVATMLEECGKDPVALAHSIRSDGDPPLTSTAPVAMTISVFADLRRI